MSNRKTYGETLIINEELFKLYSQVSNAVGIDKCYPFLQLAQSFYLEPILGTPLLTELQYQVEHNELTELNKALITKIAPCLSAWTDFLSARSLAFTFTQKGLTKEKSENSESLNNEEMAYYIHNLREIANQSQELLVKYLCRCQDSYPLFRPSNDCDCRKYLEEYNGDASPEWRKLMYFPNGKRDGCPHCDRN